MIVSQVGTMWRATLLPPEGPTGGAVGHAPPRTSPQLIIPSAVDAPVREAGQATGVKVERPAGIWHKFGERRRQCRRPVG
jgi:hypothetical protein